MCALALRYKKEKIEFKYRLYSGNKTMGLWANKIYFRPLKEIKNPFLVEIKICIKFYSTKFNFKSIGDYFKFVAYLVLNRFAKNACHVNKKAVILKLSPIDLKLNVVLLKLLQILIPTKWIFNFNLKDEKYFIRLVSPWAYFRWIRLSHSQLFE